MNKKLSKIRHLILVAWLLIVLPGCNGLSLSPVEELLRAPKITGDNAAIQQAFESDVGSNVSLVTPLLGEYRSAYVFFDYDRDTVEEAVVFYTKPSAPNEVHMHLLDKINGEWTSICDVVGNGSEVQKIQFANLDRESDYEFAVTWTVSDSKRTKTLSVYKYCVDNNQSAQLKQITALQLQDYLILDLDLDGYNEVLYSYSNLSSENPVFDTAVFRIDAQTLSPVPLCEISLSKNIDSIVKYSYDKAVSSYNVYIDCLAADGRYFTEILAYDYEKASLVRPQDAQGNYLCNKTYRADAILCEDCNEDYLIDIPAQFEMEGSSYLDSSNDTQGKLMSTVFYTYTKGELSCTDRYYYNDFDGFRINITDWYEQIYIVYSVTEHTTRFRLKEAKTEDDLLFSIKWVTVEDKNGERNEKPDIVITDLGNEMGITVSAVMKKILTL